MNAIIGGIVAYRAGKLKSGNVAQLRMYHASMMFFATVRCVAVYPGSIHPRAD